MFDCAPQGHGNCLEGPFLTQRRKGAEVRREERGGLTRFFCIFFLRSSASLRVRVKEAPFQVSFLKKMTLHVQKGEGLGHAQSDCGFKRPDEMQMHVDGRKAQKLRYANGIVVR
jgi:hypothetical protein